MSLSALKTCLGKSHLFDLGPFDLPDNTEHSLLQKYLLIVPLITSDFKLVSQYASNNYSSVQLALAFGILAEPSESLLYFQVLHHCVNDNWTILCNQLKYFTFTTWHLLKQSSKKQLFWLVQKLIAMNAKGADGLLIGLIRQIKGGDHGIANNWITRQILNLLLENGSWLSQQATSIPFIIYTLLRLISESGIDLVIRSDCTEMVKFLLQNHFKECSLLGRDLVRILWEACQKDFALLQIWEWIQRDGLIQMLLSTPTPKKYVLGRLTPIMEQDLMFILEQVSVGNQKEYEIWWIQKHLNSNFFNNSMNSNFNSVSSFDSINSNDDYDSCIGDCIRHIVLGFHPTNAQLSSHLVPRWMILMWLVSCLKNSIGGASGMGSGNSGGNSSANAIGSGSFNNSNGGGILISLYFDWLFFDPKIDNIMNIEPAALLLQRSILKKIGITMEIIKSIQINVDNFYPPLKSMMQKCLFDGFNFLIEKGVLTGFEGLWNSASSLPGKFKEILKSLFERSKLSKEAGVQFSSGTITQTLSHSNSNSISITQPASSINSSSLKSRAILSSPILAVYHLNKFKAVFGKDAIDPQVALYSTKQILPLFSLSTWTCLNSSSSFSPSPSSNSSGGNLENYNYGQQIIELIQGFGNVPMVWTESLRLIVEEMERIQKEKEKEKSLFQTLSSSLSSLSPLFDPCKFDGNLSQDWDSFEWWQMNNPQDFRPLNYMLNLIMTKDGNMNEYIVFKVTNSIMRWWYDRRIDQQKLIEMLKSNQALKESENEINASNFIKEILKMINSCSINQLN